MVAGEGVKAEGGEGKNGDLQGGEEQDESAVLHPLQHSWYLWLLTHRLGSQRGKWSDSQQKVHEFGTVEDFERRTLISPRGRILYGTLVLGGEQGQEER